VEVGKWNQLLCYSHKSKWREGTEFRCNLPYNTTELSYGKYKNTNTIRCHGSKMTTPRKRDQTSNIFKHAPKALCSQTHGNQKDQEKRLFLRMNSPSSLKKENNTHLLTAETTRQLSKTSYSVVSTLHSPAFTTFHNSGMYLLYHFFVFP